MWRFDLGDFREIFAGKVEMAGDRGRRKGALGAHLDDMKALAQRLSAPLFLEFRDRCSAPLESFVTGARPLLSFVTDARPLLSFVTDGWFFTGA